MYQNRVNDSIDLFGGDDSDEYAEKFYGLFCQLSVKECLLAKLQEEQNKLYKDVVEITEKIEKLREKESQFMKSITNI